MSFDLVNFLSANPEIKPLIVRTEGKNSKWGRVVCEWNEKKGENESIIHKFIPLINLATGEIYLDDSKKEIYPKFIAHTIFRPFHIAFKTFYHFAIPISIPHIIYTTIRNGIEKREDNAKIAKKCLKNSVKSLVDIVHTPVHGIAMMIVSIAAVIIGPLAPQILYDFRAVIGKLIQSLNWKEKRVKDRFFCFQSITRIQDMTVGYLKWNEISEDTIYKKDATNIEIRLNNFARAYVFSLRKALLRSIKTTQGITRFITGDTIDATQIEIERVIRCLRRFSIQLGPTNSRFESPSYGDVEKALRTTET